MRSTIRSEPYSGFFLDCIAWSLTDPGCAFGLSAPRIMQRNKNSLLPNRRSPSLNPPVLARADVQLIPLAVMAGKLVALLRQGNIDDPLTPLVLVKNDLPVIGSSFCSASKDIS